MSFFKDGEKQFILSYDECKNIYRTATLGKRIVEGLVNFAMSADREIDIHKAPPEAIEQFKKISDEMKQDEAIKRTIYNSRIYGTGALYVAMFNEEEDDDDYATKPTFEDAHKYKIKFTVLDPLNISGSTVDLNPLSFNFLEVINIKINSKSIPRKRIVVSHALEPLYLDSRTSLIPFSPPSVFYNMVELLKQYDDAIKSIGDLLYKAGAIIYKYPAKAKLNGVIVDAVTASKQILEQKRSGEVIAISADSTIEDFPISNLSGLIESINKLEDDITKALNDTPASILFDKSLSNGFSEGDKDKETEISIIESFRENKLTPLYNLTDYYVMLKAWDKVFIEEMRNKYREEYQDKTDNEIFRNWAENFKFQYGNLFPEPESITHDNNSKKLDNLLKAQQLGVNPADLQEELNESGIFKNEMELDSQPQGMEGAEDDEEMFDSSDIKADADNIPPNTEWKTLDNGEHILVNEHGTVLSGVNDVLHGKYFKNKDTGKFEKYTFNEQSLASEAEKEYNENKEKESKDNKEQTNKEKKENVPQSNTPNTINNQKETKEKDKNTNNYSYISNKDEAANYLTNKLNLSNNELNQINDVDVINNINKAITNTKNVNLNEILVRTLRKNELAKINTDGVLQLNKSYFKNKSQIESAIQTPEKRDKLKKEYNEYINTLDKEISELNERIKNETNNTDKVYLNRGREKRIKLKRKIEKALTNLNYRYTVNYDNSVEGQIEQTINHELGHNIFNSYFQKNNVSKNIVHDIYMKYKYDDKKYTEENISLYALENYKEFFAECYSMYCNENERKKLNKDIIDIIERIIKGL